MSDCSTNALKPKDQPKTCGNCSERIPTFTCNCLGFQDFEANDTPDDDGMTRADYCTYWKHNDGETLEQCHEQLEQVAKKMYEALIFCMGGCIQGCPMLDDGCSVGTGVLKNELIALGVSVDD